MERYIVHIDMDAFFASVEQRDDPGLRGKPVIVGSDPEGGKGRGVVATCSYEARRYGIHSAMPVSRAFRLCPQAAFLPVAMDKYLKESERIFAIVSRFTPFWEPLSIDEAFLDITGSYHLFSTPEKTCLSLQKMIKSETGLSASLGLAPNKTAAKIASDLHKPEGFVEVAADKLLDFLHPLSLTRLWGVGPKTASILKNKGCNTIGDIASRSEQELVRLLGQPGRHLLALAQGIDERPVEQSEEIRSISNEHTFRRDTDQPEELESVLMYLAEKLSGRLRKKGLKGKNITLKIRTEDFVTASRTCSLDQASNYVDDIYKAVKSLFLSFDRKKKKIRLLGIKVSRFSCSGLQLDLFYDQEKNEHLHLAVDRIREKFGEEMIFRARRKK